MEIMRRYHSDKHEATLKEQGMVRAKQVLQVLNDICAEGSRVFERLSAIK